MLRFKNLLILKIRTNNYDIHEMSEIWVRTWTTLHYITDIKNGTYSLGMGNAFAHKQAQLITNQLGLLDKGFAIKGP